ncbi:MAG: hypothetical protein EHM13_15645, partial [Acidobacteria bacterium]
MRRAGLFAIFVLAAATAARAQSDNATDRPEVDSLTLVGVQSVDEGQLRSVLGTQEGSWLPWGRKVYFDRDTFERDLLRIVAFYRDRGFPRARVVSHDIELNERDNEVHLTVRVEEGTPTVVSAVDFEGFEVAGDDFEDFAKSVPVKEGEPVVHQEVLTAGEMAVNLLREHGYPHARAGVIEEQAGPHAVRVQYQAIPGSLAVFGPIEITGNSSVSDAVIRRRLSYRPGEMFRRSLVRDSQRRLSGLELFEFVNIDVVSNGESPDEEATVPTRVTVVEGKHRRVLFSAGYGTEEKVRVEGTWRHTNFYGGARLLDVRGKWSSIDRGGEI